MEKDQTLLKILIAVYVSIDYNFYIICFPLCFGYIVAMFARLLILTFAFITHTINEHVSAGVAALNIDCYRFYRCSKHRFMIDSCKVSRFIRTLTFKYRLVLLTRFIFHNFAFRWCSVFPSYKYPANNGAQQSAFCVSRHRISAIACYRIYSFEKTLSSAFGFGFLLCHLTKFCRHCHRCQFLNRFACNTSIK